MKFKYLFESQTFNIKAFVTDIETGKNKIITFEEDGNTIKDAIKSAKYSITKNGYRLHKNHIAEEKWYDYLSEVASYANNKYIYDDVWKYLDKKFKNPEDAIEYVKEKTKL